MSFVHLHLHTAYSLLDSTIRIPAKAEQAQPSKAKVSNLLSRTVELGLPAVTITDLHNQFALVKFYKAAESVGIKPIVGADVYVMENGQPPWLVTLLCRNHNGYLNLSRLLSRAWLEGHRSEGGVAVQPQWLKDNAVDLFALMGRESLAARCAAQGRLELATQQLTHWQSVWGENLHLELTRTGRSDEPAFNQFALHSAAKHGLPVVASNDVRFLSPDDFDAHEARVCIASGRVLDDAKRPRPYSREQYLKSAQQMAELFADVPDALSNTLALAQRCNLTMRLGTYFLPDYPVPDDQTLDSWISRQAHQGLQYRLQDYVPTIDRKVYETRLEFELETIIKMGFSGYFLIVADFIQWGKQQGIPIGPGRGSGAGSLVAWALQITDLDPIPYNLLFERFLNPERVSMPDFDIDFCMDRRDEVIDYVARKYGRDRVSQIITYGTMAAKAVVRDAGRVLGFSYGLVDGVARLVPNILGISLKDALGQGKEGANSERASPDLINRYQQDEDVRDLINLALQLEDLPRNAGKHAGGVVIAPKPLSDFCPLYAEPDSGGRGKNPVTQFDKNDVEEAGLVKFDFLGLRTLTIINWAVKAINQRNKLSNLPNLDISHIALDDEITYRTIFATGNTGAVFQFESSGMRRLLKDAKPDRFEDLIALVSLYRPGPMDLIPDFVARKHGKQPIIYPDPRTETILRETYGIMVYQEQVMQMAQIVGGYSLGGADLLRRAMGKKVPAEMAKHREIFRQGAAKGGVSESKADEIFDLMEKFAGYGFNKSHAAAYALVSYQTAWLKCHYPAEFMAATLSSDMDNTDKVAAFLQEVKQLGLHILPPQVNESDYAFQAVAHDTLRYGLGAIKSVGQGACQAIVAQRKHSGAYTSLLDFCKRTTAAKLNRRVMEALIHSGALDGLAKNRASLMMQLPEALKATEQWLAQEQAGQSSLFGNFAFEPASKNNEQEMDLPQCDEWPLAQRLENERMVLGFHFSGHPFDPYADDIKSLVFTDLAHLDKLLPTPSAPREGEKRRWQPEAQVLLAGMIMNVRRKGESQLFAQLEDGKGQVECAVFADELAEFGALLNKGRVVVVKGGLREDEFNGGYTLRLRQCWDYDQLCANYAAHLFLSLDGRDNQAWLQLDSLLAAHRPGRIPIRLELYLNNMCGQLELGHQHTVKINHTLLESLRQHVLVKQLKLVFNPPWSNGH